MRDLVLHSSLFVAIAFAVVACSTAREPAAPLVRVHAAHDLVCPDREIRVTEEFGGRYKAVGCGRKAYYSTACDGLRCSVQEAGGPFVPWREPPDDRNDPAAR